MAFVSRQHFTYFEVVRVEPRVGSDAELEELRGLVGAVLGWSADASSRWPRAYVVHLDELDRSWTLDADDLVSTGDVRRREDYYDGSSVRVSGDGEVLGYPTPGGDDDGEPIDFRAHRGARRASVYREYVLRERLFDDLVGLAREHGAELVAALDPYDDEFDKERAELVAADLKKLELVAGDELREHVAGLRAVFDFCWQADETAWVSVTGP